MKNDDAELIQRTLEGDQHAFAQLVEKYQEQVHTLAWQKIGDYHIAQEITQDVFITAYQKFATFTHYRQFAGWLYVVTNRKCIAWHRKKKIETQSIDETNPTELDEAYYSEYMTQQREEAAKEKRRTIVQKLLSKLQESDRTVMNLYYIAEMSCEEIAEFLGVAPNTVRSRLHRARNRLKKEEAVIKENLSSFQLPKQMVENIMKEISHLKPIAPSTSKPFLPWVVSSVSAILVFLLVGAGIQYQHRHQKPYSFQVQSDPTIEIVDSSEIIETQLKPDLRNQLGRLDRAGKGNGAGEKEDDLINPAMELKSNFLLSEEAAKLFEHLMKEIEAYDAKLKSGKMEFSITLSQENRNWFKERKPKPENIQYEDTGHWHITHNFEGRRHFYDVKARNKQELKGKMLPNWQETHHQFQFKGKKLIVSVKTEAGWVQTSEKFTNFESMYDPRWWGWHPWRFNFKRLTAIFKPIDVQLLEEDGTPLYFLTLRLIEPDLTRTTQIWIDPQKGYRIIRIFSSRKFIQESWIVFSSGIKRPNPPEEIEDFDLYTYQLEQFEPGIWFPKTATWELNYNPKTKQGSRKIQMQVHKAVFNIPITARAR
ncbi:hypothetical protein C6501_06730 [Candidatus Poribacteria bacterium]|nr:MAG: hypothetical protein C6501_06730 [Candidatus Poribacteria bacterium]